MIELADFLQAQRRIRPYIHYTRLIQSYYLSELTGGEVWLHVHSGTPVQIVRIAIEGTPSPTDPQQLRERFVARVLGSLWP